jgi:hypothetical protein
VDFSLILRTTVAEVKFCRSAFAMSDPPEWEGEEEKSRKAAPKTRCCQFHSELVLVFRLGSRRVYDGFPATLESVTTAKLSKPI